MSIHNYNHNYQPMTTITRTKWSSWSTEHRNTEHWNNTAVNITNLPTAVNITNLHSNTIVNITNLSVANLPVAVNITNLHPHWSTEYKIMEHRNTAVNITNLLFNTTTDPRNIRGSLVAVNITNLHSNTAHPRIRGGPVSPSRSIIFLQPVFVKQTPTW